MRPLPCYLGDPGYYGVLEAHALLCGRLPLSPLVRQAPMANETSVGTRSGDKWGARQGGGGGEAAGGVHLSLRRLILCELPITFRGLLRRDPARARLCGSGRLCGAAQCYPMMFWMAPSAPRMSNSAILSDRPFDAAKCSGVSLHGRRAGSRPPHSADAEAERRTRSGSGR